MRITIDTNLLVRVYAQDSAVQATLAERILQDAELIAIPVPVLCEFVWVMERLRNTPRKRLAEVIEALLAAATVVTDRAAVEAGVAALRAGGDFADGAIAESGAALGGTIFVSFDARAVALRAASGGRAATPEALTAQS